MIRFFFLSMFCFVWVSFFILSRDLCIEYLLGRVFRLYIWRKVGRVKWREKLGCDIF